MKASPRSMIAKAIPLLTLLLLHETSSHVFLRSKSRSSESGSDDSNLPCSSMTSYEGKWKLIKAYENGNQVSIPKRDDIMFDFLKTDIHSEYQLGIKAANMLTTSINITGQTKECFDEIDVGLLITTLMLPPEEFQDIEVFLSTHLESMSLMKSFERRGHPMLVMTGNNANITYKYVPSRPSYQGKWKITAATDNDTLVSLPDDDDIVINLVVNKSKPSSYNWYAKATNRFQTNINIVGTDNDFDLIEVDPGIARTKMVTMEKHEAIEMFFTTALVGMENMKIEDEDNGGEILVMTGDDAEMKCERFVPPPMIYNGKWKLTKASNDGREVIFPDNATVVIEFMETPELSSKYSLSAHPWNTLLTAVDIVGKDDDGFDEIEVGEVLSTRMAVPEEFKDIESFFVVAFEDIERMSVYVKGGKKLIMKGDTSELHADWIE